MPHGGWWKGSGHAWWDGVVPSRGRTLLYTALDPQGHRVQVGEVRCLAGSRYLALMASPGDEALSPVGTFGTEAAAREFVEAVGRGLR